MVTPTPITKDELMLNQLEEWERMTTSLKKYDKDYDIGDQVKINALEVMISNKREVFEAIERTKEEDVINAADPTTLEIALKQLHTAPKEAAINAAGPLMPATVLMRLSLGRRKGPCIKAILIRKGGAKARHTSSTQQCSARAGFLRATGRTARESTK